MNVIELVLAGIFSLLGVRSLAHWFGSGFETTSPLEQVLFTLNLTARVGLWFAFAGFFIGYALVDDLNWIDWYVFVLIGLAGLQLLTAVFLARSPAGPRE
jgi:hypothetical protein